MLEEPDSPNLTGVWNGLYSYPIAREPVSFLANLNDSHTWLTGATEEIATAGAMRGQTITATLQGRRTGRSVKFLKIYDLSRKPYDTVQYVGDINHDGTEIEGRWVIAGNWSGRFLMVRADAPPALMDIEVMEEV